MPSRESAWYPPGEQTHRDPHQRRLTPIGPRQVKIDRWATSRFSRAGP